MRKLLPGLLLALAAGGLAACPARSSRKTKVVLLKDPVALQVQGDYVHERSKLVIPAVRGRFRRTDVTRYDRDGLDVAGGYSLYAVDASLILPPLGILTFYVYPYEGSLASELERVGEEIGQEWKDVEVVETGPFTLETGGRRRQGLHSRHRIRRTYGATTDMFSDTYLLRYVRGVTRWFLKLRVSYPASSDGQIQPEVQSFMEALIPS